LLDSWLTRFQAAGSLVGSNLFVTLPALYHLIRRFCFGIKEVSNPVRNPESVVNFTSCCNSVSMTTFQQAFEDAVVDQTGQKDLVSVLVV
jgi:hypothetical protein